MMDLRITDHHTLQAGRFHAVVMPAGKILAGLNDNPVLQRYTTLFICSNFSRLLNGFTRTSANFQIQRPFTAHQLLTVLKENTNSIVLCEHDSSLYDDAGETRRYVIKTMQEVSRTALFVLYSPSMDKHFSYLASGADHVIIFDDGSVPVPKMKREVQQTLF